MPAARTWTREALVVVHEPHQQGEEGLTLPSCERLQDPVVRLEHPGARAVPCGAPLIGEVKNAGPPILRVHIAGD